MPVHPGSSEAEVIVLRTTPFSENSLIAACVSPELGRVSFRAGSALRCGRRGRSSFGLFRRLQVRYAPQEGELQAVSEAELLEDYSGVSRRYPDYCCACRLANFACANVLPGMPLPYFYRSLRTGFSRLSSGGVPAEAVEAGVLLVYMQENGLLTPGEGDGQQARQCQILLHMALGGEVPQLEPENWVALRDWVCGQLSGSDGIVPH